MLFAPARGTISICQDWKQTFPLLCRGTLSLLSKAVLQATRSLLTRSAEMWKTQGELLPNSMKTYSTFEWHWNVIFDYKTTTQKITWSYLTFFRKFNSIQCEDSWISRLIFFFFIILWEHKQWLQSQNYGSFQHYSILNKDNKHFVQIFT